MAKLSSTTISLQPAGRGILVGLLLLIGSFWSLPARSLTEIPRTFDELVQRADVVLVGTVTDVTSAYTNHGLGQSIRSEVKFNALQIIKGNVTTQDYTLQVPGGVVGRFAEEYPGIPVFHIGQRYVLFIRGNQRDFFPVVGITQGVFQVLNNSQGQAVVVRDDKANDASRQRALRSLTNNAPSLDSFVQNIKDRLPTSQGNTP